jgi:GGDEF domain-containing protein
MQQEIKAFEQLTTVLEWLMELQERHPEALRFGLIHVCFHDASLLGKAYGAQDASKMLTELAQKLRLSFRKSDIVARDHADFWILAPYTSPETVTEKVALLVKIASADGLDIVDRDVAVFSMPNPEVMQGMAFKSASEFLEHLKNNRQITFRWEHSGQAA